MCTQKKSKLIFRIGEETRPTVMHAKEALESPFAASLETACTKVIQLLRGRGDNNVANNDLLAEDKDWFQKNVSNPIVAFLGNRGSGKTSCLFTLRNVLKEKNDEETKNIIGQAVFQPVIDPSFFDEEHNILEIIVGELHRSFDEMSKNWERLDKNKKEDLRQLQQAFSQVRLALKFQRKQRDEFDDDQESLAVLSEGLNLVKSMHGLIRQYLICRGKQYLIFSIDDLDLNVGEAYRMMEQIRKYLFLPNVVILMAVKFEQLKHSVQLNLTKYYSPMLGSTMTMHEIQEMADRYLDKFIPISRRIEMPVPTEFFDTTLEIYERGNSKKVRFENVSFAVLSLTYKKCGYLFYNYDNTPSLIIPTNLRELRAFVTKLYELPERDNVDKHNSNKEFFKHYFYSQWLLRLEHKQRQIALSIINEPDISMLNKRVVSLLKDYLGELRTLKSVAEAKNEGEKVGISNLVVEIERILDPDNHPENISIGDVRLILNEVEKNIPSSDIRPLIFFVTTFYSMKLYELYDRMTDSVDKNPLGVRPELDYHLQQGMGYFPKLRSSVSHSVYDYFKLVGNSFFNLSGDTLLPIRQEDLYPREISIMSGSLLLREINNIVNQVKNQQFDFNNTDHILRMNILEFFILCSSRNISVDEGRFSTNGNQRWRAESGEFYFAPFGTDVKRIRFDISAPFVNLIYPKYAYERFDKEFFTIVKISEKSLYNRIISVRRNPNLNSTHDLMSMMTIRNMEVVNNLNLWLREYKYPDYTQSRNEEDIFELRRFFKRFDYPDNLESGTDSSYYVRTYELNKGTGDYHIINFLPLNVIYKFISELTNLYNEEGKISKKSSKLIKLFNRIYRKENHLTTGEVYTLAELKYILRESGEEELLEKEKIIEDIVGDMPVIRANYLARSLGHKDIYGRVVFSSFFDDHLFGKYIGVIKGDIRRQNRANSKEIEGLEDRLNGYRLNLNDADRQLKQITTIITLTMRESAELEQQLLNIDEAIQTQNSRLRTLWQESDVCNNELAANEAELGILEGKIRDNKIFLEDVGKDIDRLNGEIESAGGDYLLQGALIEDLNNANKSMQESKDRINELTDILEPKKSEREVILVKLQGLKDEIDQIQARLTELNEEKRRISEKNIGSKEKLDLLRQDRKRIQAERDNYSKMALTLEKSIEELRNIVANLKRCSEDFEQAIKTRVQ